jgi:hypothetical protein
MFGNHHEDEEAAAARESRAELVMMVLLTPASLSIVEVKGKAVASPTRSASLPRMDMMKVETS